MNVFIKKTSAENGQFEESLKQAGISFEKHSGIEKDVYRYVAKDGKKIEAITYGNGIDPDCEIIEFYEVL